MSDPRRKCSRTAIACAVRQIALALLPLISIASGESLAATSRVNTAVELADSMRGAAAGDVVQLAAGEYVTTRTLKVNTAGTMQSPIVLRAAEPGTAVIAGRFGLVIEKSEHVVVEGLTFTHSNHSRAIEVKHSAHIEIRNCTFRLNEAVDQSTHWVYVTGTSSHVTIRDCLFEEKHKRGCFVTLDGTEEDDTQANQIVQHCRIENCTFRNVGPRMDNGMEAV